MFRFVYHVSKYCGHSVAIQKSIYQTFLPCIVNFYIATYVQGVSKKGGIRKLGPKSKKFVRKKFLE